MLKPICVSCQRFYRPKQNGVYFIEGMPTNNRKDWKPYKVWAGDLWACPDCHATIIVGTGKREISIQHEPNFKETIANTKADWLMIKDC